MTTNKTVACPVVNTRGNVDALPRSIRPLAIDMLEQHLHEHLDAGQLPVGYGYMPEPGDGVELCERPLPSLVDFIDALIEQKEGLHDGRF